MQSGLYCMGERIFRKFVERPLSENEMNQQLDSVKLFGNIVQNDNHGAKSFLPFTVP